MYGKLRQAIEAVKIIDDHAHPGSMEYFEGLPPQNRIPVFTDLFKTPDESAYGFPYLRELHYEAYDKLYGFSRQDLDDSTKRETLVEVYNRTRRDLRNFIDKVMEAAGVDTVIVNTLMPPSLEKKANIKFIPAMDALVLPFDNEELKKRLLGDAFLGYYAYCLDALKVAYNYHEDDYEGYMAFVEKIMDDYVKQGCVGFKFLIAYVRTIYFAKVNDSLGPDIYERARQGDREAYVMLQNLIVWRIMRKAVKLDMPVQFHTALTDPFIDCFNPMNLANMLEDSELVKAKIVVLHGGYPRFDDAELLALGGLVPNNVYLDISGRIMFANHPRIIAGMLRKWLEKPVLWDKIVYGSDMIFGERYLYTCAKTGREAVYLALAGMIDDNIIDEQIAITIARKILRDNAAKLYKIDHTATKTENVSILNNVN